MDTASSTLYGAICPGAMFAVSQLAPASTLDRAAAAAEAAASAAAEADAPASAAGQTGPEEQSAQEEAAQPEAPAQQPQSEPEEPARTYYANCTEAKAAGAAPLYRGDPGYRDKLDRDQDGVACEK